MQQTQERFFIFIDKIKERLQEFAEASIPELVEMNDTDADEYKRSYHRMKSAVLGQLESIIKKASEVKEEKVTYFPHNETSSNAYYQFRTACYAKYQELDDLYDNYRNQIENTFSEDYEAKYQHILDEFESIKNKFRCKQCSSPVTINKIYFTTTYITCPSCQTKNTFEPSSQAKNLEHLGRSLAEQRTKHLLKAYENSPEKPSDLYQKYLRAMFDEWNKINPDMQEEHEKFYNSLWNDHKQLKLK